MNNLKLLAGMAHYEHSIMVSRISGILARNAGFPKKEIKMIEEAALYHDIGKNDIPSNILQKPGKLTESEFAVVKTHTSHGARRITRAADMLTVAGVVTAFHHEKWDGSGYLGMSGGDIPEYARLVAVADVFDALLSKRAYKDAWNIGDVIQYMKDNAGTEFDAYFVRILVQSMNDITRLYR
jgi:putative two-component system response regulator